MWNTLEQARDLWKDAARLDDEMLTLYLESANSACVAYAPETAPATPGVVLEATYEDGALVGTDIVFDADIPVGFSGVYTLPISAGVVFRVTYKDGEPTDQAFESVGVPDAWRLAEIMQARNTYNAAKAAPAGEFDSGSYGLSAFPLDWTIKQLLRPRRGRAVIA
jgi:hypothetical protein